MYNSLSLVQTTTATNYKLSASKLPVMNQQLELGNYPKFINARKIIFLVWIEGDKVLPNSLCKEIYRSLEKLQSPSQGYFSQTKLNIEIWISDPLLAVKESITAADFDLEQDKYLPCQDFKSRSPREFSYYLTMHTSLPKAICEKH